MATATQEGLFYLEHYYLILTKLFKLECVYYFHIAILGDRFIKAVAHFRLWYMVIISQLRGCRAKQHPLAVI